MEDENRIDFSLGERDIRALHSAILFTIKNWPGDECNVIDQEALINLRKFFQACILEFDYHRD